MIVTLLGWWAASKAKILLWGGLVVAVLLALAGVRHSIRRGAVAEERARNAEKTLDRVKEAKDVDEDVARRSDADVNERLSEWFRD